MTKLRWTTPDGFVVTVAPVDPAASDVDGYRDMGWDHPINGHTTGFVRVSDLREDTPPEEIQIMEVINALLKHDRDHHEDPRAADRHVIRRLVALGWDAYRAHAAVGYASRNF